MIFGEKFYQGLNNYNYNQIKESILLKIDGETRGVPISVELSQTSEGDTERQTSTSFLEKLGDMRPDGTENQAQQYSDKCPYKHLPTSQFWPELCHLRGAVLSESAKET